MWPSVSISVQNRSVHKINQKEPCEKWILVMRYYNLWLLELVSQGCSSWAAGEVLNAKQS